MRNPEFILRVLMQRLSAGLRGLAQRPSLRLRRSSQSPSLRLRDLLATKFLRTFAFGALSVVLAMWLTHQGMSSLEVGALLTATMITDALATIVVARLVPVTGARFLLILSALAMATCSAVLLFAHAKLVMLFAVIFGIVSPSGYEGGAFAAIEQSLIGGAHGGKHGGNDAYHDESKLARDLSHYNLFGFAGAGLGAFCAGLLLSVFGEASGAQVVFATYTFLSLSMLLLYSFLPNFTQPKSPVLAEERPKHPSTITPDLAFMSALQGLDALAGGLIVQSLLIMWFVIHFHCPAEFVGTIILWTNVFAAVSFIYTPLLTKRIGLLNVMVFTHLPCSLSLCLLPFLPNAAWAGALLIARSFFSSMDIPVRQAYTMLLVPVSQRAFANSLVTGTRTLAQSLGPSISGIAFSNAFTAAPFVVAGLLKSCYDLGLFIRFRSRSEASSRAVPRDASTPNMPERELVASSRS